MVAGMGALEMIVEVFKGFFLGEGFWRIVGGEYFPVESCDRFFSFGDDAVKYVVSAFDSVPDFCGWGEVA